MRRNDRKRPDPHEGFEINDRIKATVVQVIGDEGENYGEMPKQEAIARAEAAGLDLVKMGDKDGIAITKVMDFGRFLYARKKKQGESKKHQKTVQIKEVKMRPKIDIGDYTTKLNQAINFLQEGKRVKFTLQFRGRQAVSVNETGMNFFKRITDDLAAKGLTGLVEEKESRSGPFWSKVFYIKS